MSGRFRYPQIVAWALIFASAMALFLRYPLNTRAYEKGVPGDFAVYLRARDRVESGINPYQPRDPSPYKYAPGVLAAVKVLPRQLSAAWFVYSSLCILGMALALWGGARYDSWKRVLLLAAGLALAWKGILETLDYGQLEIVIFSLAILSGASLIRKPMVSGLIAGILPWFKLPWALLALPYVLVLGPKRIRLFASGYLTSLFVWGAAIPSLVFGSERAKALSQSWVAMLRSQPESLYLSDINQSAWVSAMRWTGGDVQIAIGLVAVVASLLLGRLTARALENHQPKDVFSRETLAWVSPWLIFTQMLNPLSWRWGSVFLLGIPFAIAENPRKSSTLRAVLWAIVLALFLIQLNPVIKLFGYHHWTELHPYGVLTGFWAILLVLSL